MPESSPDMVKVVVARRRTGFPACGDGRDQALLSSYCAAIGVTWSAQVLVGSSQRHVHITVRALIAVLEENFDVD
jgi:hypothetical protein